MNEKLLARLAREANEEPNLVEDRISHTLKRFWNRIEKSPNEDGCWDWIGSLSGQNHPIFTTQHKTLRVTRVIWQFYFDEIPPKTFVCRSCGNGICVNPRHLFLSNHGNNLEKGVQNQTR